MNALNDSAVLKVERCPKRGVAIDDALKGPPQRVEVDGRTNPRGTGHVVGGTRRGELVLSPERLLTD